jgi:hypothetical protein
METNREVKIAIIVGLIMITGCIVAFIISRNNNNPEITLDLHIYKHLGDTDKNTGRYYECIIATDELPKINNDFKRIMNLKDGSKVQSFEANIDGDYKIVSGTNFIAFDANGSYYVYRSDTTAVYNYPTGMYEDVASACSYLTEDSVRQEEAKQEQEEKQETTEKKDNKKDTKTTKKSTKKTSKTTKK